LQKCFENVPGLGVVWLNSGINHPVKLLVTTYHDTVTFTRNSFYK